MEDVLEYSQYKQLLCICLNRAVMEVERPKKILLLAVETTLNTRRRLWSEELTWDYPPKHPITITISPVHHTSTVRISISYLKNVHVDRHLRRGVGEFKKSVSVHERLHLKASS
ncbi:hypothetical protein V8B55DRAFT_1585680 [Mucor lusitanicus]|uniref:Uncharacterized protein n=1 Tax=Mucor lusitanicus CBS 277.49 TaxID=747725 RepID=A0A168M6I1_MUCCL|nr:hypothetical protein MUCCIDRAFT_91055 [Mucor lusitanicus CBS 277.49]